MLRCLLVARKKNLTGVSRTGPAGRRISTRSVTRPVSVTDSIYFCKFSESKPNLTLSFSIQPKVGKWTSKRKWCKDIFWKKERIISGKSATLFVMIFEACFCSNNLTWPIYAFWKFGTKCCWPLYGTFRIVYSFKDLENVADELFKTLNKNNKLTKQK